MMTSSAPALPYPIYINGLNHIPPPSPEDFDAEFGGLLPEGNSIPSSWGVTRYYDFNPNADSSARKVVLVHGGGTSAIGMAPLGLALSKAGNHVIAYDLWGHGASSTPLEAHTPALLHAQLLEILSFLRWSEAHLLGFSIGGTIVASFAAIHPHVAESVTLVAGAGLMRKSDSWLERLKIEGGWGREWLSQRTIVNFVEGGNPPLKDGWRERLKNGQVDTEPVQKWERDNHRGHVASLVSMFRYGGVFDEQESYRKLGQSGVKVLTILGEKDSVVEAEHTRQELLKLKWTGDIKVLEDATHELVRSHAKEVANLVGQFWARQEK